MPVFVILTQTNRLAHICFATKKQQIQLKSRALLFILLILVDYFLGLLSLLWRIMGPPLPVKNDSSLNGNVSDYQTREIMALLAQKMT